MPHTPPTTNCDSSWGLHLSHLSNRNNVILGGPRRSLFIKQTNKKLYFEITIGSENISKIVQRGGQRRPVYPSSSSPQWLHVI